MDPHGVGHAKISWPPSRQRLKKLVLVWQSSRSGIMYRSRARTESLAFISKLLGNCSCHDDATTFHVFSNVRGAYLWLDNKTRKLYECLNEYFKNSACFWPGKNHVVYDPVREAIKDKKPPEKGWCLTTTLKNGQSWSWLTPRAETWERCQSDLVLKFSKDAPNT